MLSVITPEAKAETWENVINRLKDEFNHSLENIPDYSKFIDSEREAKKKSFIEGEQTKITEKLDRTLKSVISDKEKLNKQKNKIFYPNLSDNQTGILSKSLEGKIDINNGYLFVNVPQPSELIIQTLNEAIEQERIDFASTIFKKILSQLPKDITSENELKKDKEKYYLITSVKAVYDSFREKTGIDKIENEITGFEKLEKKINNFKMLVDSGEHFIFFPEDYSKMNDSEKRKANIFVNSLPVHTAVKLKSIMHSESNV